MARILVFERFPRTLHAEAFRFFLFYVQHVRIILKYRIIVKGFSEKTEFFLMISSRVLRQVVSSRSPKRLRNFNRILIYRNLVENSTITRFYGLFPEYRHSGAGKKDDK
jgi:uncharacterized membrane protein